MPIVRVNDLSTYYEWRGAGGPLVLILGLGADISQYDWLVERLARHHRVLAFDNRGAGRTDKPDAPYSMEQMADDTAGLMRGVGLERADVLAISMGGRIAMELVFRYPQLVDRLVLVSAAPRIVKSWRRALLTGVIPRLPLWKGRYPQPYRAFARQRDATAAYDGTARLPELRVPTVILHGHRDSVAPYFLAGEMHAAIPGAKLVTFAGGHMFFMLRERSQFLEAVEKFLER